MCVLKCRIEECVGEEQGKEKKEEVKEEKRKKEEQSTRICEAEREGGEGGEGSTGFMKEKEREKETYT